MKLEVTNRSDNPIIMSDIHNKCVEWGKEGDYVDYVKGANLAGFIKVADAMLAYGIV